MTGMTGLDKPKIRQSFASAAQTYDQIAVLQKMIGLKLLELLNHVGITGTVLDVGCGTGFLTHKVLKQMEGRGKLLAMDIALPMVQAARHKAVAHDMAFFCADAERLPLANASVDIIFSNLALQWCQALPAVLDGFQRSLKAHGKLVFSTFGPATLGELKTAWASVDNYSHVNDFYGLGLIEQFLVENGLKLAAAEQKIYQQTYPTVLKLMQELKGIGAHNVTMERNRNMTTRTTLEKMMAAYPRNEAGGFTASYETIFVTAIKRGA